MTKKVTIKLISDVIGGLLAELAPVFPKSLISWVWKSECKIGYVEDRIIALRAQTLEADMVR